MRSKSDRHLPASAQFARTSSRQHEESLFKVVRRKHPRSAKFMVIIHTKIRPRSTATSINGRKRIKDADTFPSINDLLQKSGSRRNSTTDVNKRPDEAKQSSEVNLPVRKKSERSGIHTDRSSKTGTKRSLRSSKVFPLNEPNCNGSIQFNSSSKSKIFDDSKIKEGSPDGLRDILEATKKRKRKKFCCNLTPCTLSCLLVLLLLGILLGIVLTTLLVRFLPQSTTVKTSITSSSPLPTTPSTTASSISTTTTVRFICNASCVNQSWISTANLVAELEFDNNLVENVSNTVSVADQSPIFVSGYANEGLLFSANTNQSVTSPTINLANSDFTIETWIYPTAFPNLIDHSIVGVCSLLSNYECLFLTIRQSGTSYVPYFGLYSDECSGNANIALNQWTHVAFVFDTNSYIQSIYINGVLDVTRTASGPYKGSPSVVTIGNIPLIDTISGTNYFQGIIDRVEITAREKSDCEILEDATLSAYFKFDSSSFLTDSGPNSLPIVRQSVSLVANGHSNQAISFTGSSSSYFQISSVTNLGTFNGPFSISFWVRPQSLAGTLVHVSTNASGLGWCIPFVGFATNGSLVAQMYNGNARSLFGPAIPLAPTWTHIVQTWAPIVGLRLYINNVQVPAMASMAGSYNPPSAPMYVTLGNSLSGGSSPCNIGLVGSSTAFTGDIDEFRIYSRELAVDDICNLYTI